MSSSSREGFSSSVTFVSPASNHVKMDFEYIVVGAGINGAWTGYHLAKLNKKVLVIEQVSVVMVLELS